MAFNVELMQFTKKVNSTAVPGQGRVYQMELKGRTSVFNPTLILSYDGNPTGYNYCKIQEFSRYYWISSWVYDSGLWYASCAIDVLATYHDEIGNANLYVLRSAAEYDGNIVDEYYPTKSEIYNTCSLLGTPWAYNIQSGDGSYIVGIINSDRNAVGVTSYYQMSMDSFRHLCSYLLSDTSYMNITDISAGLQRAAFNPMQYVVSAMWMPFNTYVPGETQVEVIPVGYWNVPGFQAAFRQGGQLYSTWEKYISIPKHPQAASRGRYLNLEPYTQLTLEFFPWGAIPIDTTKVVNAAKLKLSYVVDHITGVGVLRVTAVNENNVSLGDGLVATATAQVCIPLQLAQTSYNFAGLSSVSTVAAAAGAAVDAGKQFGSVVKDIAERVISGNHYADPADFYGSIAPNVGEAVNSIASASLAAMRELRVSGSNGGLSNYVMGIRVNARFMYLVEENLAYYGRPLCDYRILRNLHGFCQVADGDLELGATAQEAEAVKAFLEHGVYLEGYNSNTGITDTGGTNSGSGGSGEVVIDDGGGSGGGGDGEIIVEG